MSIPGAERAERGRVVRLRRGLAGLSAVVMLVAACGTTEPTAAGPQGSPGGSHDGSAPSTTSGDASRNRAGRHRGSAPSSSASPTSIVPGGLPVPVDLDRDFATLLDARAEALLGHHRGAFTAGLDTDDPDFVSAESAYYDNVVQLPLSALSYRVLPSSLVQVRGGYAVVVEVSQQLAGYDVSPVVRPERYVFRQHGGRSHFLLASVSDRAWEAANGVVPAPWEVEPIQVRRAPGVLAVLDSGTVARAPAVLRSVRAGIRARTRDVPYGWSQHAVVYALSDRDYLATVDRSPGVDPADFDGLTLELPSSAQDPALAAVRVVLAPEVLQAPRAARDRLLRHELTHVAVGTRDDAVPVWLREGLAEWVSAEGLARGRLDLAPAAVRAARGGDQRLPADADFTSGSASVAYAAAWWACRYLATTYGASAPWRLLDRLDRLDARPRAGRPSTPSSAPTSGQASGQEFGQGRVLDALFGLSPDQLAARSARALVRAAQPRRASRSARPVGR